MITIVLIDKENNYLERIGESDNRDYLLMPHENDPIYPLVSQLSDSDLDILSSDDMPQLILELERLKQKLLSKQKADVDQILRLAKICQENQGYSLGFTPFGEFLGNRIEPTKISLT